MRQVDSSIYNEHYYKEINEGYHVISEYRCQKLGNRYAQVIDRVRFSPDDIVFDYGCGRGEVLMYLAGAGMLRTGIGLDYSADAIKMCNETRQLFPEDVQKKVSFRQGDINEINFPEKLDKAIMLDVVEHLYPEELDLALAKVSANMKDGGVLLIHTTPNLNFYKYGYPIIRMLYPLVSWFPGARTIINAKPNWKGLKTLPKDPEKDGHNQEGHVNEQTPAALRDTLRKHGFKSKIKIVPFTRDFQGLGIKIIYHILALPPLKYAFSSEIICIAVKQKK
ncbi:class I SAM-dependent methyltransferase [Thermodesulfobacteriota bacterium]